MKGARVELFQGHDGRWYFHRKAANNKVTDPSQGYRTRWGARRAIKRRWPDLPVIDA